MGIRPLPILRNRFLDLAGSTSIPEKKQFPGKPALSPAGSRRTVTVGPISTNLPATDIDCNGDRNSCLLSPERLETGAFLEMTAGEQGKDTF